MDDDDDIGKMRVPDSDGPSRTAPTARRGFHRHLLMQQVKPPAAGAGSSRLKAAANVVMAANAWADKSDAAQRTRADAHSSGQAPDEGRSPGARSAKLQAPVEGRSPDTRSGKSRFNETPKLAAAPAAPPVVLVIDDATDWSEAFPPGTASIQIEQVKDWRLLNAVSDASAPAGHRLVCSIAPSLEPVVGAQHRVLRPAAVLIRSWCGAVGAQCRNLLLVMAAAGAKAVNSLSATLQSLEWPLIYGELLKIRDRLGVAAFPLADTNIFADTRIGSEPLLPPALPLLATAVTTASSGRSASATMKFGAGAEGAAMFNDFRSVLALHNDCYLTRPLGPGERADGARMYRVLKIGSHYRLSHWPDTCGQAEHTPNPRGGSTAVEQRHRTWADACANIFGGLDVLAIDVLVVADGSETILNLDTTPSLPELGPEEFVRIRDLLLGKIAMETAQQGSRRGSYSAIL